MKRIRLWFARRKLLMAQAKDLARQLQEAWNDAEDAERLYINECATNAGLRTDIDYLRDQLHRVARERDEERRLRLEAEDRLLDRYLGDDEKGNVYERWVEKSEELWKEWMMIPLSERIRSHLVAFKMSYGPNVRATLAKWIDEAEQLEEKNAALERYISCHPSGKTSMAEFDEWYEIVKKNDAMLAAQDTELAQAAEELRDVYLENEDE